MSKRINISVSDIIYNTLKKQSVDYGIPLSSIGSMAIIAYLEQKQALSSMGEMQGLLAQINALQEGEKK